MGSRSVVRYVCRVAVCIMFVQVELRVYFLPTIGVPRVELRSSGVVSIAFIR